MFSVCRFEKVFTVILLLLLIRRAASIVADLFRCNEEKYINCMKKWLGSLDCVDDLSLKSCKCAGWIRHCSSEEELQLWSNISYWEQLMTNHENNARSVLRQWNFIWESSWYRAVARKETQRRKDQAMRGTQEHGFVKIYFWHCIAGSAKAPLLKSLKIKIRQFWWLQ